MSKCSLSAFTTDNCGESIHHPLEIDTVELKTCHRSIESHLRALGVTDSSKSVKEGELIAYRVGFFVFPSDYRVCPRHRDILGLHWRAKASCQYPNHVGKAKPYRSTSICMSRRILIEKGVLLPVGSGICRKCHEDYLKLIKGNESTTMTCGESSIEKRLREEETLFPRSPTDDVQISKNSKMESDAVMETHLRKCIGTMPTVVIPDFSEEEISSQETHQSSQCSNWSTGEEAQSVIHPLSKVNKAIELISRGFVSPLRSQLSMPLENSKQPTARYYKRKALETTDALMNAIAPNQGLKLKKIVMDTQTIPQNNNQEVLKVLCQLYANSKDNSSRCQVLSLIVNQYPKSELLIFFQI